MMRKRMTGWVFGGSALGPMFAGAIVAACSSSSSGAPDAGGDAAASNGGTDAAGDGNFLLADGGCLSSTYDIETVEAGAVWACYQDVCGSQLTMCAGDCVCNDDILTALQCTANGGSANDCFTAAFAATYVGRSSNVVLVGNCIVTTSMSGGCPNGSPSAPDAGTDGSSPDAGQDVAPPDGSADGALPDAAPDSSSPEAAADGAGGDAAADVASADSPTGD